MQLLGNAVNLLAGFLYDLQALIKNMHCTRASLLRIEVAKQTYLGLVLAPAVKLTDKMRAFLLATASSEIADSSS
jgi:hypothetical protein